MVNEVLKISPEKIKAMNTFEYAWWNAMKWILALSSAQFSPLQGNEIAVRMIELEELIKGEGVNVPEHRKSEDEVIRDLIKKYSFREG